MTDAKYYRHANLFVGNTPVPPDGHFGIDNVRVRILAGREESEGWHRRHTDETDERWLIIEEPHFWPVMVRLSVEDMREIRMAVNEGLLDAVDKAAYGEPK
jgi:hypothetical protein